jgi:SAM-dependent methyltransferase
MTPGVTIESSAYFDQLAEFEDWHWWSPGLWRLASYWLDDVLKGRRGLHALDVGCGAGMTALRLATRAEITEVVGLDPSSAALAHARRRHGFPLVRGSALQLPFKDSRFHLVTCLDVLQHLPIRGDDRAVEELARVLTPDGIALVRTNGRGFSCDHSSYTLAGLTGTLTRAGFTVRRASYANCLPSLVQELRGRLSRRFPPSHPTGGGLRFRSPHPVVARIAASISATEAVVAGRFGVRLPFGHSTMVLGFLAG